MPQGWVHPAGPAAGHTQHVHVPGRQVLWPLLFPRTSRVSSSSNLALSQSPHLDLRSSVLCLRSSFVLFTEKSFHPLSHSKPCFSARTSLRREFSLPPSASELGGKARTALVKPQLTGVCQSANPYLHLPITVTCHHSRCSWFTESRTSSPIPFLLLFWATAVCY